MKHFALLTFAALSLMACTHTVVQPAVAQKTVTTSSVQNQCTTTDGVQMSPEECTAHARELDAKSAATLPGAQTVTTGKTCTTVNGVTNCTVQ